MSQPPPPQAQAPASNPRSAALAAAEARMRSFASSSTPSSTPNHSSTPLASLPTTTATTSPSTDSPIPTTTTTTTTAATTGPLASPPLRVPATQQWMPEPATAVDEQRKVEVNRQLYRSIVRDGGYVKAAICVETLLKIATNILTSSDPKYRDLKADNGVLRDKVLSVPGAHEFMITMGFRVETREFVKHYVLQQTSKRAHDLNLCTQVLRDVLPDLQSRAVHKTTATISHKADEARRVAAALREIDADRMAVKARAERERLGREAVERQRREDELAAGEAGQPGGPGGPGGARSAGGVGAVHAMGESEGVAGSSSASDAFATGLGEGTGSGMPGTWGPEAEDDDEEVRRVDDDDDEEGEVDENERRKRFDEEVRYSKQWGVGHRLGG